MSRVSLDANVLFSSAISEGGASRGIFELADQYPGVVDLIVSERAIKEALVNLQRKRQASVGELLILLDGLQFAPEPPEALTDRLRDHVSDPKDVPILAGAVWAEADLLVTGNSRHFGHLYGIHVGGCLILPPREAVSVLLSEAGGGPGRSSP
ncbi:MAG: PIN domain-containing protein [Rubrobacter sp.]